MQPQGHVQILLNMLHHGANAQSTLDAPRFCISADVPKDKAAGDIGTLVYLEDGVKPEVVEQLKRMGHDVELLSGHARAQFGRGQVSNGLLLLPSSFANMSLATGHPKARLGRLGGRIRSSRRRPRCTADLRKQAMNKIPVLYAGGLFSARGSSTRGLRIEIGGTCDRRALLSPPSSPVQDSGCW